MKINEKEKMRKMMNFVLGYAIIDLCYCTLKDNWEKENG